MLAQGLLLAFFAVLGLVMGSFLNVCIDRLPGRRSIISPPSACDACNHKLGVRDLVPLFSYLWLRGRCRYCGAQIPRRLPAVELAMGIAFAFLYWRYGLSLMLGLSLVYTLLLALIFVIDIERQLILDRVVYTGMGLALAFSVFYPGFSPFDPLEGVKRAALGGVIGLALMLIIFVVSRGGMGFGDVKMAALVGLIAGFPQVFIALFLAVIAGGLVAGVLLVARLKTRRQPIPFGPFLAVGAMLVFVWGNQMQEFYRQLFS